MFSKEASNKLPPHRPYNYKIVLEGEQKDQGYCPLYRMTQEELAAVKKYIEEFFKYGFIVPSQASIALPVLFVRKPNRELRFYVNYRKLNAITKKSRYPLPLIDETLAKLLKAEVFTKLDVRQAFYRIRMDPNSKDLTTFQTRFGSYKYKALPFGLTNGPLTY